MLEQKTAYLAPDGFVELLVAELENVSSVHERLVVAKGPPQRVYWCQNVWFNPVYLPIKSIKDAASQLRAIQRNWCPYVFRNHRRCELIQQSLPHVSAKPVTFLQEVPKSALGSWTLLDENTILASSHCSSPVANGAWDFVEDKLNPPSRAYLKLWEFFTRFGAVPNAQDVCLDLGASPGGWTFVLAGLAQKVIAIDRSPLVDNLMQAKNVEFSKGDAFNVDLKSFENVNWVFSDVICYPEKLLEFAKKCLQVAPQKKYVFTVKFQGKDNSEVIKKFAELPGQLVHLSQNKHELTWFKVD